MSVPDRVLAVLAEDELAHWPPAQAVLARAFREFAERLEALGADPRIRADLLTIAVALFEAAVTDEDGGAPS